MPRGETGEGIIFLGEDDDFSSGYRKLEGLVRCPSKDVNRQLDLRAQSSEAKYGTFYLSGLWNATGSRVLSLEGLAQIHLEGFISHTLIGTCVSPEAMD